MYLEDQTMQATKLNLAAVVDRLGSVKGAIADLQAEEAALKKILAESGEPAVDGQLYRASISQVDSRPSIDWRAIAEKFNPSRQLVVANTTYTEPYSAVRVSARKTS